MVTFRFQYCSEECERSYWEQIRLSNQRLFVLLFTVGTAVWILVILHVAHRLGIL